MGELRKFILMLLAVVIFVAGIYLGATLLRFVGGGASGKGYSTPAILQQVQTLSQLVTVKYVIEKAEVWNDPPTPVLSLFGAGDNHILLLANGIVKAGVDLSQLQPNDLQITGKKIVVRLPPPRITDAYLDDKETKVVERKTGFLRAFDKDLEQNIRENAVQEIRGAAIRCGILSDANERAVAALRNLFQQLGFEEVEFHPR